jgi:DNA-binding transcriptional ArsR family regulator
VSPLAFTGVAGERVTPNGSLALRELEARPPRIVISPAPSVFLVAAEVAGAGRGVPDELVQRARAQLEPSDLAALAPVGSPRGYGIPDVVTISDTLEPGDGLGDRLERLAATSADELLAELAVTWSPSPLWRTVARSPRRWLALYTRALARVWKGIREPWNAATALLERETERIETAAGHGALPEIMGGIHHRASVEGELWHLHIGERLPLRLPESGLTIAPVLGGPGCALLMFPEESLLSQILYPLPGALGMLDGNGAVPASALEALLGPHRAAILRMLDRPCQAGDVARRLTLTPGGVTHHLKALEASGLIVRERDARNVLVHRTARGTLLLGLYESA